MTDIFPSGVRWTVPLEVPLSDAPRATMLPEPVEKRKSN